MDNSQATGPQPTPGKAPAEKPVESPPALNRQQFKQFARETWAGFSKVEKYILWVFFVLGGGFILLMLVATIANIVHRFTG